MLGGRKTCETQRGYNSLQFEQNCAEQMKHQLEGIFRPSSVAVIGASTRKGTIGRETLHNILMAEFCGKVFPVNPKSSVIHSIQAYATIPAVPDAVDLAIHIVP